MRSRIACFTLGLCLALTLQAQVRLAPIFTDNLVLQQHSKALIWGWTSPGRSVKVQPSWSRKTAQGTADKDGKFLVTVETPAAGGPYQITVSDGKPVHLKNVLIGEVWICAGQSNMEMPMKGFKGQPVVGSNTTILHASNPMIRLYTVPRSSQASPRDTSKRSDWKVAGPESVSNFSATGWFFGRELQQYLQVPVGLINISYGGSPAESWMSAQVLGAFPEIQVPGPTDTIKSPNRTPTTLYNGMLHPVVGYTVRGFTWYQGESNYDRPDQYERLFPAMVAQWRSEWKDSTLPFYFAQIAPYNYGTLPDANKKNSAYLRDAQRKSVRVIPHSGMAVLLDVGEEGSIHPARKQEAGERLALVALTKTYRAGGFAGESPDYDTLVITNGIAEVKFRNAANWLTAYGKELSLFEIAGKDKVFYPAKAVIYRSSVLVSSPQVKEPVAVRYAFRDFVTGELFSTEGLPVSSFRTDNW